jgi:four helix bundle protein
LKELPRPWKMARQLLRTLGCFMAETLEKRAGLAGMGRAQASSMSENNPPHLMSPYDGGQNIRDRTFEFACRVVRLSQNLFEAGGVARLMVAQLVACSVATNTQLEEARAAESDRDFISKCCISLKECRETWTRLRVCAACRLGPPAEVKELVQESNELIGIIYAIIRNKRLKMTPNQPRRRYPKPSS